MDGRHQQTFDGSKQDEGQYFSSALIFWINSFDFVWNTPTISRLYTNNLNKDVYLWTFSTFWNNMRTSAIFETSKKKENNSKTVVQLIIIIWLWWVKNYIKRSLILKICNWLILFNLTDIASALAHRLHACRIINTQNAHK